VVGGLDVLLLQHRRQHKGALEGAIGTFPAVVAVVFGPRRGVRWPRSIRVCWCTSMLTSSLDTPGSSAVAT
jgi:hypothetical protein